MNIATLVFADAPGGITGIAGNPEPISGPHVFGLGDFSDALIFSRKKKNGFAWGVGAIMSFPIATDERLGSGKWSAGPAIRLAYDKGPWRFGMVAGNFSSFAGDDDRSDIDQLLIRGLIKRELNDGWFLKYSPIITANWEAESSQRWLVPLGGGVGKSLDFLSTPANLAVEYYSNVIKPDGAPESVIRIALTLPLTFLAR